MARLWIREMRTRTATSGLIQTLLQVDRTTDGHVHPVLQSGRRPDAAHSAVSDPVSDSLRAGCGLEPQKGAKMRRRSVFVIQLTFYLLLLSATVCAQAIVPNPTDIAPVINPPNPQTNIVISLDDYLTGGVTVHDALQKA